MSEGNTNGQEAKSEGTATGARNETPSKKRFIRTPKKKKMISNVTNTTSGFVGGCKALKDNVFVFSQLNTKRWITSREKFIDYACTTYGGNEETSLEQGVVMVISHENPEPPSEADFIGKDSIQKEFLKDEIKTERKQYKEAIGKTRINLTKLFKVLWDQCDPIMKNKIKAEPGYLNTHNTKSAINLLALIETVCEKGDAGRHKGILRFVTKKRVLNFRQTDDMDLGEFLQKFQVLINIAEKAGVTFYEQEDIDEVIKDTDPIYSTNEDDYSVEITQSFKTLNEIKKKEIIAKARDRAIAIIFIMNANDKKYAIYKQELYNAMAKGRDEYPKSVVDAHTYLDDETKQGTT